jgi:hypothetical protein
MKKLILLLIPICITEFCFSQTDFRKGYVITNARDTLFGFIDYREKAKAYSSCDFKVSKGQNTITYEPGSIIGYGFENDKFFQTREISIKNQPSQVVFLEVIVRGFVSLYKFGNIFFIEKADSGLQQLINENKEVTVRGKSGVKKTNQHIGTINMLLFDCVEIRTKIQKVGLDERSLANLVEDYNRCKGVESITFKVKKPWTKAIIGVNAGLNISQLDFNENPGFRYLGGEFENSNSLMLGVSLEILSPRLTERISFHSQILYLTSKYYSFTLYNSSAITERNYVTIELQQLKVPIGIRYTFPRREFTPYFNLGASGTVQLSSSSKWIQEVEANSVVNTYEEEALVIRNRQFGLWAGCGVLKSIHGKLNAFIELRYEQTDGITPFSAEAEGLSSKISNLQVFIGIRTK